MRFFKAFTLLHRRTKSEPVPHHPSAFDVASPVHAVDSPYATFPRTQAMQCLCFSSPTPEESLKEKLGLEKRLKDVEAELTTQTNLVIALTKTVEDKDMIIATLRSTVTSYERNIAAGGVSRSPQVASYFGTPASLDSAAITPSPLLLPSVIDPARNEGTPRTLDNYYSALQLTLDARKELQSAKKVAKFWKRKAADNWPGDPKELLTPSPSDISDIYTPLPSDRQAALDALVKRRRELNLSYDSALHTDDHPSEPQPQPEPEPVQELDQEPEQEQPPLTPRCAAGIHEGDPRRHSLQSSTEVGSSTCTVGRVSSSSSGSSYVRLAPLASESMKAEVDAILKRGDKGKKKLKRASGSTESSPTKGQPSKGPGFHLEVDSFGDLRTIFETTFGRDCMTYEPLAPSESETPLSPGGCGGSSNHADEITAAASPGFKFPLTLSRGRNRSKSPESKSRGSWSKYLANTLPFPNKQRDRQRVSGKENIFSKKDRVERSEV